MSLVPTYRPAPNHGVGTAGSRPTAAVHGRNVDLSGMAAIGILALPNTRTLLMLAGVFQSQRLARGHCMLRRRGRAGPAIHCIAAVTVQGFPPYEPSSHHSARHSPSR
jgi:hypothetical protein